MQVKNRLKKVWNVVCDDLRTTCRENRSDIAALSLFGAMTVSALVGVAYERSRGEGSQDDLARGLKETANGEFIFQVDSKQDFKNYIKKYNLTCTLEPK